jgi:hypothetical protein
MKMSDSDMASKLIAVVVEQRNQIVELESQVSRLNQAVEAHAISGIGELNEYLMENEIGIVGDMTAKAALDHVKDLKSRFTSLDEANDELLGDYLVAEERVKELEIKLNARPDPPEPEDEVKTVRCPDCGNIIEIAANNATEDAYLSDFRVLKTAIEIVSYAMDSRSRDFESAICTETKRLIRSFTENVRLWNGLDTLEPYKWSSLGSGVNHLIDKEWKK